MTIRDVAEVTGVPPAPIVRHYQPKDGLRDPADDHAGRNLEAVLAEIAPGPAAAPSVPAALTGLAGAVIRHLRAGSEVPGRPARMLIAGGPAAAALLHRQQVHARRTGPAGVGASWRLPRLVSPELFAHDHPGRKAVPSSTSSPATGAMAAWAAGLLRVRWLARAPTGLYRARLGFLLGSRLLMLEHLGRKSGARRYVVLEAVAHPRPGTYVVASGFGARAQWFRNVRANPHVRVYAGGRRPAPATARLLTSDETAAALAAYAAGHPRAWAALKPVFETTLGARISDQETSLPMIAFELAGGSR